MNARLYGILDLSYVAPAEAEAAARELLLGGVQILQLRAKRHTPQDLLPLAKRLADICRESGIPFIVNDFPALARDCGADGVHIGQDDGTVAAARAVVGSGRLVGKSTHSLDQALAAAAEQPDYIGFGPLFATLTKPDYIPVGLEAIRSVQKAVALPVFCIGGIKLENLWRVLDAGARRVVVVSGILLAADRAAYCRALRDELEQSTNQ